MPSGDRARSTTKRTFLSSVLGGGGRGLGVANLFALLYVTHVLQAPGGRHEPHVRRADHPVRADAAGRRLAVRPDRRRPTILGAYLGGALGFIVFIAAGSSTLGLWVGIAIMGLFSFAESPQLQALLADAASTGIRDVAFALYFTLAFGVGSLWIAVYGAIIEAAGEESGLPIVFGLKGLVRGRRDRLVAGPGPASRRPGRPGERLRYHPRAPGHFSVGV